jgi:hypothetical protein
MFGRKGDGTDMVSITPNEAAIVSVQRGGPDMHSDRLADVENLHGERAVNWVSIWRERKK